jgi:hypothetical protein
MRAWVLFACLAVAGCKTTQPPVAEEPKPAEPRPVEPEGRESSFVTSSVVIGSCPDSAKISTTKAEKEIDELVGSCTEVPGGAVHFSATLLPGGQIELGSPEGDPSEGMVPTCVVQTAKQLKHKLKLKRPCRFDVKLEQRT